MLLILDLENTDSPKLVLGNVQLLHPKPSRRCSACHGVTPILRDQLLNNSGRSVVIGCVLLSLQPECREREKKTFIQIDLALRFYNGHSCGKHLMKIHSQAAPWLHCIQFTGHIIAISGSSLEN